MKTSNSLIVFTALISVFLMLFSPAALAQSPAIRARVAQPVDAHDLVALPGNVHPLARHEFDQGAAPDDQPMERILLVLQRGADQEAALRQLLDDQQVSSSPRFHQWLTPEQFGQQFGPADSDLQAVTDWLAAQGFTVKKVAAGRTVIEFSGTAGLVHQALGTEMHRFRVNGEDYWANSSDPQIPTALAPVVAGFAALHNFTRKPLSRRLGTFTRSKATGEVQPLFTFPYGYGNYYAVGPWDFATIYNVLPLWNAANPIDGTGQTIAVVGETNINPQDVADFRTMFGLPANPPNIILNGPDPGITSDEVEADIDVQWSGAVAKGATIDLVVSESTEVTAGIDLSALYIIDNNLAPIMSESYGSCEASLGAGGNQFYNTLWEQAAAQGITVLMAAGDSGSAGCDGPPETAAQYGLAVGGFASTPFNVAVGGTDFNDASNPLTYWSPTNTSPTQSSAKSYIPESTWNDSCAASGSPAGCSADYSTTYFSDGYDLVAGSGGPSNCINPTGTFPSVTCGGNYLKPAWQSGAGVPNDGARDIPDLSLFAGDGFNNSFYVMCQMDANASEGGSSASCDLNSPYLDFQGTGGTSTATQAFAGIMALVNQRYGRQGNANYVLYPMAAQNGASCNSSTAPVTNSSCVFYDVTVGNNSVICQGGTPNCSNASTASSQYGIMVSGGSPAYVTTTGYDLATGLGSVNVANLVNQWTSNFAPSTTTLSLSTTPPTTPISLTHGQPINFNITVTSGSGTPTGDVSLIAQTGSSPSNSTGIGPFTLSGGSVSNSTIMLPGGSYNVTAHYPGNGTFAASDSTPGIPVTVSKESSQTEVRLVTLSNPTLPGYNITTVPYGSPYFLRMDVTNSSGNLCAPMNSSGIQYSVSYPCPTGSLTVSPAPTEQNPPAGTVPGSYTLNTQGYAEDQPIQQPPGLYNFVATYAGDSSYNPSTSPTVPITISQAPTTVTISGLPSTLVGTGFNLTATANTQSNGVAPTGTMQLYNNGAALDYPLQVYGTTYSSSTGAYAKATVSFGGILPAGSDTITVEYSGDSNYAASTSAPAVVDISDFSMSASPSSITIPAAGQSGQTTVSLTPLGGLAATLDLSCSVPTDTGITCSLSSSSVTLNGSTPATVTLMASSTGSSSAPSRRPPLKAPPPHRSPIIWPWWLAALLGLAALLDRVAPRRRALAWLVACNLLIAVVWVACGGGGGGGNSTSPPPPQSPSLTLSPTSMNFGQVTLGSKSATQTVTATNATTSSLTMETVSTSGGNNADFVPTFDNCFGAVLAAGASCMVTLEFWPTAAGLRTSSYIFNYNGIGSPQSVSLSGTATQPATQPGTYWVQVIAVTPSDTLAHSFTVTLTVQ